MPSLFARLRVGFVDHLPIMTEAQMKTFIALLLRSDLQGNLDVTTSELSRTTGLGRTAVRGALNWLASPVTADGEAIDPYIKRDGETILIPKYVSGERADKRFTLKADEDPDKRVKELENIITQLTQEIARLRSGSESGLAEMLPDDETAKVVRDIEHQLARGLSPKEIYYLGQMIDRFGPKPVLREVKKNRLKTDPLRAAYGFLNGVTKQRGGSNKRKDVPEERVVDYATSDDNRSIWDGMD